METKELKITIPEGYEIDKEKSTFEKIIFKKKENTKPRSWKEYCHQQQEANSKGYYSTADCDIYEVSWNVPIIESSKWRNVLPSKELSEAFLAMMQLMSLRQDWIHKWSIDNGLTEDWKPVWTGETYNYCIIVFDNKYVVEDLSIHQHPLSFPTKEIATDFMDYFKDLLNIAKPLI